MIMIVETVPPTGNRQGGSKAASKLTLTVNTQVLKSKVLNILYGMV